MSQIEIKFKIPQRFSTIEKNIWLEYAKLAEEYKPINLGQGFPDYPAFPDYLKGVLEQVANTDNTLLHQYTRDYGHPRLVNVLSKLYSQLIERQINPQTEILVAAGAYEALFCSIMGHIDVDDEVIIIEPFFDCYESMVKIAGGIPKFIPLRPISEKSTSSSDWILDKGELESLFNTKTKMIILNSPNNPLGKVFRRGELEQIAELCKRWNVVCLSDEVFEWIVFKPFKHIRMASLPGMWDRTITVGSAGKSFGVTGWRLGWAYGPANLLHNLLMVHQNSIYTAITPIQEVTAICFEKEILKLNQEDSYFNLVSSKIKAKRDFVAKFLTEVGMKPILPEGGYFITADWSPLETNNEFDLENDEYKDCAFTKWMIKNLGIQGIPSTTFYSKHKNLVEHFVRFCFFKKSENLEKAAEILKNWKSSGKLKLA